MENKVNNHYDIAYAGKFDELKQIFEREGKVDADMVLMGASSASYKLLQGAQSPEEIKKIVPLLTPEEKAQAKLLKSIEHWAIEKGASPLFGIQEKYYMEYSKQPQFFARLRGKKAGDVTRGDRKKAK